MVIRNNRQRLLCILCLSQKGHYSSPLSFPMSPHPPTGISNVSVCIEPNVLCAVIGPVGAGKSTLLQVMLGELQLDDGFIHVNGRISYASQQPWLFEGSIKQNIVFVEPWDERR